ncbi:hypothetical protein T4B_1376, partial [Trichinella pseudospiralis]
LHIPPGYTQGHKNLHILPSGYANGLRQTISFGIPISLFILVP